MSASAADHLVQEGFKHHQAGRLEQANSAYQQALHENPDHPEAQHLLGMLAHQVGNHALARDLILLALHTRPDSAIYHCNLGTVLESLQQLDEAIACFRKAISLNRFNPVFHYNLAHALQTQGNPDAAIQSYHDALTLAPNHIESLSNLGHLLQAQGKLDEAIICFKKAVTVSPGFAEMHFNLGTALNRQGRLEEAIASYRHAIECYPDYAQAHCNLGAAYMASGNCPDAIASFQQAIAISPDMCDAHYNLGNAMQEQHKLTDAIASYQRALELQPNFVAAHCNLGNALRAMGRLDEAQACYRKALSIKPDYANAYSNLLFLQAYHGISTSRDYLADARGWELACLPEEIRQQARVKKFVRAPASQRRLKVAYLSGDFRKHAVSYFMEQLLAQHDRTKIELYAYSNNYTRDEISEKISAICEHWIPIAGMSDEAVCAQIDADGIDVLIDLAGHSAHNRMGVFARRAAPIQASYLYFASTGLSTMDYWIGDEMLTPPALDNQFSETVWRLPRPWLAYQPLAEAPAVAWQPASDGTIWLGCFNNLGKITPPTLKLWAEILLALPEARLFLKNKELADPQNCQRIVAQLAGEGITAERVLLEPGSDWHAYMAAHNRVDIALDPIEAHGGGTSTCDALWMGVPVIHLLGTHTGSRFAASLLKGLGHEEWITHSSSEYVQTTIALARNVALRKQLRPAQREKMIRSPLADARGLAHALEDAYSQMFQHWYDTQTSHGD